MDEQKNGTKCRCMDDIYVQYIAVKWTEVEDYVMD